MIKLQNSFVALLNMDIFPMTLKFSLFTVDRFLADFTCKMAADCVQASSSIFPIRITAFAYLTNSDILYYSLIPSLGSVHIELLALAIAMHH